MPAGNRDYRRTETHKTVEQKQRRQEVYLEALRNGSSEEEASAVAGLSRTTLEKWRYHRQASTTGAIFRDREKQAREDGRHKREGLFPTFLSFRERHFAYYDKRRGIHPATGQKWAVRATNSFYQNDAVHQLESSNQLIMIMPPGHIKTTLFGIELNTYDIMRDRDVRLLTVSRSQDEAKKIVAAVQLRLSDHGYYHEMAKLLEAQGETPITCPLCEYQGPIPFKPQGRDREAAERWGAEAFIVGGRSSGEKDATMEAKGYGSQIQGVRSDRITLDDIQDPQMALNSPKDSTDKLNWFRNVILGRVTGEQQIVVLGNFFAPDDFAHKLITAEPEFSTVNYPAIRYDADGRGHLLCPEFWTYEDLMKKQRQVGDQAWHFTWMQEEGSFDSQTFKREVLEAAMDAEFTIGQVPYGVTDVYIGCDPATASGGYCAIVVWGLDRNTKQRYLIDVFNEKGMRNIDNVVAQLIEMASAYVPRKVIVEGNAQQKAFINSDAFQRGIRSLGIRYEVYQTATGAGGRAQSSNFDITTIGGLFDGGLVTLPGGGTEKDLARVGAYIDQLCEWRTDDQGNSLKHLVRDMVMATLFAESEAYVMANRTRDRPVKIRSQVRVPRWARSKVGAGYHWTDRYRREPAEAP